MIGNFAPIAAALGPRVRSLSVFERIESPNDSIRPAEEAVDELPRCQVALITATSIINHTIEPLLLAARGCREVVVLGASTSLLPEAFAETPVTLLSGVVARDAPGILQVISEGGGMRQFSRYVQKVSLRVGGESKPPESLP
jgi:uncharacterized protein